MKRTTAQSNRLHGLLNVLGIDDEQKAFLVAEYTEGRSTSSKDLTFGEAAALIIHLDAAAKSTDADRKQVMRRKAFAIAHELGWEGPDGKVDRAHFDQWMLKYGYLHKPITAYSARELPQLLTQLENVLKTQAK